MLAVYIIILICAVVIGVGVILEVCGRDYGKEE